MTWIAEADSMATKEYFQHRHFPSRFKRESHAIQSDHGDRFRPKELVGQNWLGWEDLTPGFAPDGVQARITPRNNRMNTVGFLSFRSNTR